MSKPRIPELETCFVCCSLRTGAQIISMVSVVLGAILCATFSILIVYAAIETVERQTYEFEYKFTVLSLVMTLIVCALFEVASLFLWIGVKQYKETYVLSWAITVTAFNFIQVLVFLFIILYAPVGLVSHHYIACILVVLEICGIFYVALVVYSYYRELRRLKNAPQSFRNEA